MEQLFYYKRLKNIENYIKVNQHALTLKLHSGVAGLKWHYDFLFLLVPHLTKIGESGRVDELSNQESLGWGLTLTVYNLN